MGISTNHSAYYIEENEALQKQRETFIASLSHDLKNPTIAQIRAIELLLKGKFGQIAPEQREIIEMILDSCRYMNAMLGNVLSIYKNEQGTINLKSELISIADIALECTDEMVYLAKDKGIKIMLANNAEKETVWGDGVQLKRVIMNLLSNGIKYAYPDTELKIDIYNESNYTCCKFKNKSQYLSPEKQEKIFAKYISFSKNNTGIGLGLYASKKIIEAYDGKIFVESFLDDINIFGFKIPNDENLKDVKRSLTF